MSDRAQQYKTKSEKKPVNLSINRELVEKARALNINLSQALENTLVELIREQEKANWISENNKAIDEYNKRIDEQGAFSDSVRKF